MSEPWIRANSPGEFVEALRRERRKRGAAARGPSGTPGFERLQMRCFLLSVAESWEFGFPVQVYHTSDCNPDFVIETPSQKIGVECSRITTQNIGLLNKLAAKGEIGSAYSPTPLLVKKGKMKPPDLRNAATGNLQFHPLKSGNVEEEFPFWIQSTYEVLKYKTAAMDKPNYQPCDQYWLLLRDEMAGDRHEIAERARIVHEGLTQTWLGRQKWFSRVVIQDESLDWHVTITRTGVTLASV